MLVTDLASPKAQMNERTATLEVSPKLSRPIRGSVERSSPTIAPTSALTATRSENCARFSRSPSSGRGRLKGLDQRATGATGGGVGGRLHLISRLAVNDAENLMPTEVRS